MQIHRGSRLRLDSERCLDHQAGLRQAHDAKVGRRADADLLGAAHLKPSEETRFEGHDGARGKEGRQPLSLGLEHVLEFDARPVERLLVSPGVGARPLEEAPDDPPGDRQPFELMVEAKRDAAARIESCVGLERHARDRDVENPAVERKLERPMLGGQSMAAAPAAFYGGLHGVGFLPTNIRHLDAAGWRSGGGAQLRVAIGARLPQLVDPPGEIAVAGA